MQGDMAYILKGKEWHFNDLLRVAVTLYFAGAGAYYQSFICSLFLPPPLIPPYFSLTPLPPAEQGRAYAVGDSKASSISWHCLSLISLVAHVFSHGMPDSPASVSMFSTPR